MTLEDWTFVGQLWCVGAAALLVAYVGWDEWRRAGNREKGTGNDGEAEDGR